MIYVCLDCDKEFSKNRSCRIPKCPSCGSRNLLTQKGYEKYVIIKKDNNGK